MLVFPARISSLKLGLINSIASATSARYLSSWLRRVSVAEAYAKDRELSEVVFGLTSSDQLSAAFDG
jgi:hypothetical protein